MTETGVINKIEQNLAWVTMIKGIQCTGCNACKTFGDGSFEIVALNEVGAKAGDNVEVEINPRQVVKHSTIIFILPVLSLIVGYFLGDSYLTRLGLSREAGGIFGSLGLMIITFVAIIGYDRMIAKSQQVSAQINRIL